MNLPSSFHMYLGYHLNNLKNFFGLNGFEALLWISIYESVVLFNFVMQNFLIHTIFSMNFYIFFIQIYVIYE
jgi:hypothetical protein